MAEQNNEKCSGVSAKTLLKVVIGVVLVILGLAAIIGWWSSLWVVFRGCIGLFLVMAGAITIAIAKE